jgi:hypothetical protein
MQIRVDKLWQNLDLLKPVVPKKATLPVITHGPGQGRTNRGYRPGNCGEPQGS